eukprot:TRINITY_DN1546_c1_g2_i1.p1 TRINITY_DN1546_c1_g2~~TRINITY_DN1546_c1_g2_i1.p1  ORF type:complete len:207 (-),score=94.81 TRINITY_DN1546_c1_g2_i1:156-776(-)
MSIKNTDGKLETEEIEQLQDLVQKLTPEVRQLKELVRTSIGTRAEPRMKPPRWLDDDEFKNCPLCLKSFSIFTRRKHHCRRCGTVICQDCSPFTGVLYEFLAPGWPAVGVGSEPEDEQGNSYSLPLRYCIKCDEERTKLEAECKERHHNLTKALEEIGADAQQPELKILCLDFLSGNKNSKITIDKIVRFALYKQAKHELRISAAL